jgi:hypothetical protein
VQTYRDADFITCLEATGPFKIAFDHGPTVEFEQGLTYRTRDGFKFVDITNESAGDITVTIGMGRGDVRDARLSIAGTVATDANAPEIFTAGAPVSALNAAATLIAAADLNRREILLVNAGAGTVYIGSNAAAGAGAGLPLVGGQSLALTTSAAIYARNDSGAAVDIHAGEMAVV